MTKYVDTGNLAAGSSLSGVQDAATVVPKSGLHYFGICMLFLASTFTASFCAVLFSVLLL